MTNTEQLRAAIEKSGLPITTIAARIGITRETLYNKLNGVSEFKASEIASLTQILRLTKRERDDIFFALVGEFGSLKNRE